MPPAADTGWQAGCWTSWLIAPGQLRLETTITADNEASQRLFTSFAARHGAECTHSPLFVPEDYPDGHDTEHLYEIAPLGSR